MREITTTEALMTDPTTEEGRAYWQDRHDYEEAIESTNDYDIAVERIVEQGGHIAGVA